MRASGILFISHNIAHAHGVGDHFLVLDRGQIVARFRRGEIPYADLVSYMESAAAGANRRNRSASPGTARNDQHDLDLARRVPFRDGPVGATAIGARRRHSPLHAKPPGVHKQPGVLHFDDRRLRCDQSQYLVQVDRLHRRRNLAPDSLHHFRRRGVRRFRRRDRSLLRRRRDLRRPGVFRRRARRESIRSWRPSWACSRGSELDW